MPFLVNPYILSAGGGGGGTAPAFNSVHGMTSNNGTTGEYETGSITFVAGEALVFVGVENSVSGLPTFDSVTIKGVAATQIGSVIEDATTVRFGMFRATVTAGSGTVVVDMSGDVEAVNLAVIDIEDFASVIGNDTVTSDATQMSVNLGGTSGYLVSASLHRGPSGGPTPISWSGDVSSVGSEQVTNSRNVLGAAISSSAASGTRTATATGTGTVWNALSGTVAVEVS